MSNIYLQKAKRPLIWLSRFRHRCGYGVHSPFAFGFITDVIYEKRAYYCYGPLREVVKNGNSSRPKQWQRRSDKLNRLLFRISNYCQPDRIFELGRPSSSILYMCAARHAATVHSMEQPGEISKDAIAGTNMVCIDAASAEETEEFYRMSAPLFTGRSICVVMNIHASKEMKACWQRIKNHERSGITFDLYDLGIIFFDHEKIKQHYIVNFTNF